MCCRFESYRRSHLAPKPKGEAPARHAGESGFESRRRRQYSGTSVHGGTLRSGRSRRGSIPWSQTLSADKVLPAARPASNRKARVRPSLSAPNCRRGGMHTHSAQNAASSRTWGFESLRRHHFGRVAQQADALVSKTRTCGFDSRLGHQHPVRPVARRLSYKEEPRVRFLHRVPFRRRRPTAGPGPHKPMTVVRLHPAQPLRPVV